MPKPPKAWLIPENLTPPKKRCVVLYVPDDRDHYAAFWGALIPLAQWQNWERDENKSGKILAAYWKEILYDAWERFLSNECVPKETQEPPKQTKEIAGGSELLIIGEKTGWTIDELEDFVMSYTLRNQLAWVDGKLCYWSEGCCGWQEIPIVSGISPVGAISPPSDMTIDEWLESGTPPTPDIEAIGNEDTGLLQSDDAAKCAKATAIVDFIWDVMAGWVGVAGDFPNDVVTISGFVSLLTSWFPWVSIPLGIAGTIFGWWLEVPAADVVTRLETAIDKETEKQELICDLVPRMATPTVLGGLHFNRMTDDDIKIAFERFEAIVKPHEDVMDLLKFFPVSAWKGNAAQRAETSDCGCEDFLPYGYTPPTPGGSVRFNFKEFGYSWAGQSSGNQLKVGGTSITNLPYDSMFTNGRHGQLVSGKPKTVYTLFDGTYYWTGFMALYEFTQPVDINSIKWTGALQGAASVNLVNSLGLWWNVPADDTWQTPQLFTNANNVDGNTATTQLEFVQTISGVTTFGIAMAIRDTGSPKYWQLDTIKVTGSFGGSGFFELNEGELFTP